MRKHCAYFTFAILIFILILQMPRVSQAQTPAISNGLNWLNSAQSADGSWDSTTAATDSVQATSAVLQSLAALNNTTSPNYVNASNWLATQTCDTTRYLSGRLKIFATASADKDLILSYVDELSKAWGGYDDITVNNLDTAFALQALKAANYSDTTVLYQAINYLTTNQNADGGWAFVSGGPSNAYVTAIVLRSLTAYNSLFLLSDPISKASSYLLTKQNADGGFGSSPSNVYESALSVISLIENNKGDTETITNGINYLASTQSSDGSWNQDPYYTALALQALAAARPNLTVSGITLSKSMPREGEETIITATVKNAGYEDANNVVVRFYLGDPASGGVQIGTDQTISPLAVNSSSQVSITSSFTGTGGKTIFVVVDPGSAISETSESDNKSSTRIWVATAPDLAVFSEDLKPSTYVPVSGTAFTLEYTIRNLGESATDGFDVALYDGNPSSGGTLLQTTHISGLAGTEVRTGSIGVTLTGDGAHSLYMMADAGYLIQEISEANNIGSVTVQVGGVRQNADLVAGSINLTPSRPHANETVQISASVRNEGLEDASSFTVEIFDGAPESNGSLIHSQTISLAAGAEQIITTNFTITSGIHDIYVVLDRMNGIIESDENNNRASVRIMTDMVDISISATDLSFNPVHPVSGDSVVLSVTVHNQGIKETGAFNLALYDGDPAAGGALLQTFSISSIPGDGSATLPYTFTATPWTYRFYAVADTENVVAEMYETNNQAIRSLKIKAPGEILGPELVPVKIDLTGVTTSSQTLALTGNALVTFQNKGDAKITSSFDVLVFEDADLNGAYTPGLDNLLGAATNTQALWPEGANMVSVPLSGTVKFLHSPLYALVDSGDAILEQDETNNLLISCADCENRPASPIEPVVKWRYNQGHGTPTPAIVANLIDTNGDGKIDEKDVPEILFIDSSGWPRLFSLRGDTGQQTFQYDDGNTMLSSHSYIAVGDLDNDGYNELVATSQHGAVGTASCGGVMAIDHTGKLKWNNGYIIDAYNAGNGTQILVSSHIVPIIADIDNDGKPEIILETMGGQFTPGYVVAFNGDGTIKWAAQRQTSARGYNGGLSMMPTAVDLDLDGKQEILADNAAFNSDGTLRWKNSSLYAGINVIGNFDDDPYPEIVFVTHNPYAWSANGAVIYLLDHDGKAKWGPVTLKSLEPSFTNAADGSVPVIADFDGDGQPEIGIRGWSKIFLLDKNGVLKQSYPMPQVTYCGSNIYPVYNTAPTVFDLNGDGKPEVIIDSNEYFQIFDGKTGTRLFQDADGYHCGSYNSQRAIVSDVDEDGHAEIVVLDSANWLNSRTDLVRVYGAKNNDWVGARKIWNQAGYHVTNVNDDGSIPQYEAPSWLLNNTYHTQAAIAPAANPYRAPNLTASYVRAAQSGSSLNLTVRIGNGGAKEAASGVTVAFYDGDPSAGPGQAPVIGAAATTRTLMPGEYQDITFGTESLNTGQHRFYAVVDSANAISECNEDDNQAQLDMFIGSELPDLVVGPEDIILPSTPYYEGSLIPITVNVRNAGLSDASHFVVRLSNGNPMSGGTQLGADQVIQTIGAGGSASVAFTFDTLGRSGDNVLYISVDPGSGIAESNEHNNSISFTIKVSPPELPDLAITPESVQITPATVNEGDSPAITATIRNRGAAVSNVPVRFYLGDPESGGRLIAEHAIYPIFSLGETATVQATLTTTGRAGQQNIYVKVDPANTITETREDNNTASRSLFIQSAGLASGITLNKPEYRANEEVMISVNITNLGEYAKTIDAKVLIEDNTGAIIKEVAAVSNLNFVSAPAVNPVTITTASQTITLSGAKPAGTSIVINGTETAPLDGSTIWQGEYILQPGVNTLSVVARNASGYNSEPVTVNATYLPPLAIWHMDGNWKDSSGNGHDGTPYNGVKFSTSAKLGPYAGSLDGVNDYVEVIMKVPQYDFTIEAWAKTGNNGGLFSANAGNYAGSNGHDRHMYVNSSGYACFRVWQGSGWCTAKLVNDNAWHHWALVVETGAGQKAFIDGQPAGTNPYDHSDFNWQDRITIGYSADRGYFNGLIDEVVIYNRALSEDEIKALYDAASLASQTVNPLTSTSQVINLMWNTGSTYAGDYKAHLILYDNQKPVGEASAGFTIAPTKAAGAKVVTDKISYNPNETVTVTSTVTSLSGNYVMENSTARMTVARVMGQGSGEDIYAVTKTINTLMPGAAFTFKSYCPAATAHSGTYTARLEVLSGQTVLASSSAGFEVLSTSRTGAGLSGAITATTDPVYQGREETFGISVTNNGIDDLSGLAVSVIVADPDTGAMKAEAGGQTIAVGQGRTITGTVNASTLPLEPKKYLAILQARTAEMAQPRTLASVLFEVKPGIEVTKTVPDIKNVLVWLNYPWQSGKNCPDRALIEEALSQAGVTYHIVLDKKDFAAELENIFYTDIIILGDHHPLEDHVADVLAARIAEGKGLLTSLFTRQSLNEPVLGIKFTGTLPGEGYVVDIPGNELGIQGSFPSAGRLLKVEALRSDEVIAWTTGTAGSSGKGQVAREETERHPAIIKRQYGEGKVIFLAFDLAMSSANIPGFPALLRNALEAVHKPLTAPYRPGLPVPVELTVKSLGAAFDIRTAETYPAGVRLFDPASGQWIENNPWVTDLRLEPNQEKTLLFYALPPEQPGSYTLRSEVGYLDNGAYAFYQELKLDIEVGTR